MAKEEKLSVTPLALVGCKYDLASNDIFLFLTKEGLKRLRKGDSNRNFTLTVIHQETKTRFDLMNDTSNRNGNMLEVVRVPEALYERTPDHPSDWYVVKLDDRGYDQLNNAQKGESEPTVMDRYGTSYKVFVTVDEEMVASLAEQRLKNKTKTL